jgi:hypothetical protein
VRLGQDLAMEILALVLSVGGVTAIVLVCWLAGGARTAVIADAEAARIQLQYDEPTFQAAHVLVAGDGRTALLASGGGTDVAAVMVFGDKLVTRRFGRGAIREVALREQPAGRILSVLTDDPTCRRIDVVIDRDGGDGPDDRDGRDGAEGVGFWVAAMERLRQGAQGSGSSDHPARIHAEEA